MRIGIPGRVWEDYLNPLATAMETELELEPTFVRRGRGHSVIYEATEWQARALSRYLYDRAAALLGQGIVDPYDVFEKTERDTHRAAICAAEKIRAVLAAG